MGHLDLGTVLKEVRVFRLGYWGQDSGFRVWEWDLGFQAWTEKQKLGLMLGLASEFCGVGVIPGPR